MLHHFFSSAAAEVYKRKDEVRNKMKMAGEELYVDYANDIELTAFTTLDLGNFYETR